MKTYKLNIKERQIVEEFKNKLLKKIKDKIVLVRIFGSKIRGNAKRESDIDILVVYRGNGKIGDLILDIEWEIIKKYNYNFYLSVIPYKLEEYKQDNKIQTPFIYNVNKEGITLWDILHKKIY